jgi:NitT/TauT family transport system permease protein
MQAISRAFVLLQSDNFWRDAANTGKAFVLACAIAIVGGVVTGLALGFSRLAAEVADPILGTISDYPARVRADALGQGRVRRHPWHFSHCDRHYGALRNVPLIHRRTARALRLSGFATVRTILAPAALPEIFSGIRIGVAVTLLGTLLAELFASSSGVGFALIRAMEIHNVVDIFALTLLIFLFAAVINTSLHGLERKLRPHG